jgi:trk system potassium uptake protein TrkH
MIRRVWKEDYRIIGFYTGRVTMGVGLLMLIPMATSLVFREWASALDFAISVVLTLLVGYVLSLISRTKSTPGLTHAMVIAAGSWLIAMALSGIPYMLSGHMKSFLDACFDTMSGYTTTGMFLLQDLDHISQGLNMWRHLLTYVGGQGIVVLALTFLIGSTGGAFKIMVGEGKEEKLEPNVRHIAVQIWRISLIYLFIGTVVLGVIAIIAGIKPYLAFFHGAYIFMSAWSTGGFAPFSQNMLYYHSAAMDTASMVFFILGSYNFALHYAVWTGNRKEILRNIEIVSFCITVFTTFSLVCIALMQRGVYPNAVALFRRGFFQLLSGHTTTGQSNIYARTFVREWGPLGMLATTIAMAIGASAASTGGGFKGLRMGLVFRGFFADIKKLLSPERAVVTSHYHHIRDNAITDSVVKGAAVVIVLYVLIYMTGTVVGMAYGYPMADALFEAVSAGSNTGLSCGVTQASMPTLLKIVYILEMWMGRLEFMSVFTMFGFIATSFRSMRLRKVAA